MKDNNYIVIVIFNLYDCYNYIINIINQINK